MRMKQRVNSNIHGGQKERQTSDMQFSYILLKYVAIIIPLIKIHKICSLLIQWISQNIVCL